MISYPPPLIENEHRDDYLKVLGNDDDLCLFLEKSIINSLRLIG